MVSAAAVEAPYFDPMSPEFRHNPYPILERLVAENPIVFKPELNGWFISRYEDCVAVMRDPRFGKQYMPPPEKMPPSPPAEIMPFIEMSQNWLFNMDPPQHTRVRNLVHKAFTPRRVELMRERVQIFANELLDKVQDQGRMDIVREYANPIPMLVIAELMGVPIEDYDYFAEISDNLVEGLDVGSTPENMMKSVQGIMKLGAYFEELIPQKRQNPGDDLTSALIQAEESGQILSDKELMGMCVLMLSAGYETTANLIANGTLALLENPEQMALLRSNPDLADNMTEEALRYYGATSVTFRVAQEDIELKGHSIQAGQQVMPLTSAANRDPEVFANPSQFDITRPNNDKQITFGFGIHYCVGAPLARIEGSIAFNTLLSRFKNIQLATDEVRWMKTFSSRALVDLPVTFEVA